MNLIMKELLEELKDHIETFCNDSTTAHKSCAVLTSLHDRYAHFKDIASTSALPFPLLIIMSFWMLLGVYVLSRDMWNNIDNNRRDAAILKRYEVPVSRVHWEDEANEAKEVKEAKQAAEELPEHCDVQTQTEEKTVFGTRCYPSSETSEQETYEGETAKVYSSDSEVSESIGDVTESDSSENRSQESQETEDSDDDSTTGMRLRSVDKS